MKHVVFCGTHPSQYNGYSKVVFELAQQLCKYQDIKLYIFGFQNFYDKQDHKLERNLPGNVEIYDVYKNEQPKSKGFGETLIVDYVKRIDPDIVIIYNDLVVITSLIQKLNEIKDRRFKLVPYIDIVYKNEKNNLIKNICQNVDAGIMFTQYWKDIIKEQGFNKELSILEHGFNKDNFYPIPKKIARLYFNISETDFVIVNLNRNQPRKRWDICIMAFVKFMKKHMDDPIKLMIATSMNGGWDLIDIMISECRKNDVNFEEFKKHLIVLQNPQQISDKEINVMYNVGNIGINTCDGEGFGLCNFEQAGVGVPQIVPKIGGFRDFFNKSNSILIQPKWSYYCDHSRDFVAGEAEVCEIDDFVNALEYYYSNRKIVEKHGMKARNNILKNYSWEALGKKMYDIIHYYTKDVSPRKEISITSESKQTSVDNNSIEEIDINELINKKLNEMNKDKSVDEDDEDDEVIVIEGGGD